MRLVTISAAVALLSGCTMPTAVPPVVAATPEDIAAEVIKFAAVPGSAQAYLIAGWSINTARCSAYFNSLTVREDQNLQTERGLALLGAAGAAGVAIAGGPVGAAAAIPMAAAFASGLAANQADLGGAPPVPTFGLIQNARNVFQTNASVPPTLDVLAAKAYADRLVQEDMTYCQPAGAQLLASQAIMAAKPVVMSAPPLITSAPPVSLVPNTQAQLVPEPPLTNAHRRRMAPRIPQPAPQEAPRPPNFFEEHPPAFHFDRNGNPMPVPPRIGIVR